MNNPLKYTDPSGWIRNYITYDDILGHQSLMEGLAQVQAGMEWMMGSRRGFGGSFTFEWTYKTYISDADQKAADESWLKYGIALSPPYTIEFYQKPIYQPSGLQFTQPFAMGMANVVAPTGDMAAMGGGTQNGGSSQTFLKSGQDMGVDGAAFGNLFRKKIGINVLNLTKGDNGLLNPFVHLTAYTAMYLGGTPLVVLKARMDEHERGSKNIDSEIDKKNNDLVINKYIPKIDSFKKNYNSYYDYSIEILKLMNTIGYYRLGDDGVIKIHYLKIAEMNRLIEILENAQK